MSVRKVASRYLNTPGSGVKGNTKSKPPTPKQALNSTVISKSPPRLKTAINPNITINTAGPCFAPKLIATDWSLQCDLAYSEYLRAVIAKDITQITIKEYEEVIDDQLSRQAEFLHKVVTEKTKLENEIQDLEIQIEIEKLSTKLNETYATINEILENYNVNQNLNKCIVSSENACNKLYLKNIKPFKTQEDYDKFSTLLQSCTEMMQKLKSAVGNTEDMKILGEHMKKFIQLQDEFLKKRKMLRDLQVSVGFKIFKTVSDRISAIRDYNEE